MTVHKINDHDIEIPEGMLVDTSGMFDTIVYRGFEICTYEDGKKEGGLYVGPFNAANDFDQFDADTLPAIKNKIDEVLFDATRKAVL